MILDISLNSTISRKKLEVAFIPSRFIKFFIANDNLEYDWNVLSSNVICLIIIFTLNLKLLDFTDYLPHECLFHILFNIDCPGCGITRALSFIMQGEIIESLRSNPGGMIILILILVQIFLRYHLINNLKSREFSIMFTRNSNFFLISILLIFWISKLIS